MSTAPSTAPTTTNTVTMALDDHMVYAFCVATHSLVNTSEAPFRLVVGFFPGKLSLRNQHLVHAVMGSMNLTGELRELRPNPLFTERRHLTMTTFSKFLLSDQISQAHLWLDIDTVARPGWEKILDTISSAGPKFPLVVATMLTGPETRFAGFNAGVLGWTAAPREEWEHELSNMPQKRFSSEQYLFNTLYANTAHHIDTSFNFLSSWFRNTSELKKAKIIHYSGPIKPWHLPRRHRRAWLAVNSSWEYWFLAEDSMKRFLSNDPIWEFLKRAERDALFSGRLHTGKGALAGWVMRALSVLGPLGTPLVQVILRTSKR